MSRTKTLTSALVLLASLATAIAGPAHAAKSSSAGSSRGKVYVSISNDKNDPNRCSYKITGSNLLAMRTLWADTSNNAYSDNITALGFVDGNGVVQSYGEYLYRSQFNRLYTIWMFTDGWGAVMDIYGQPAAISISNNCAP